MTRSTTTIRSWDDVLAAIATFRGGRWIFRGENRAERRLTSSLERVAVCRWGHDRTELPDIERGLQRRFMREAQRFLHHLPPDNDWIGWQGLMRHHGAPTRLLDWTYSFFVALHFAVSTAKVDRECSLWCINVDWLQSRTHGNRGVLPRAARTAVAADPNVMKPETIDLVVRRSPAIPLVYPLNPFGLHERLVLQQGVFVVSGDLSLSFQENLEALGAPGRDVLEIRLRASRDFLKTATEELGRMNVTEATLFPGLDGFARHLAAVVPFGHLRAVDPE